MVSSQPLHAAPEYQLQNSHLARLLCCFLFVLVFCMSYRSYGPSYLSLISISLSIYTYISLSPLREEVAMLCRVQSLTGREREREREWREKGEGACGLITRSTTDG